MTQPLLGWGLTPQALTNVTPFTYRDNATYIELMKDVRDKVNEVISVVNLNAGSESTDVTAINNAYTALVAQWNATLATLDPTQVSVLVSGLTSDVSTALANSVTALSTATTAEAAVTTLTGTVNTLDATLTATTATASAALANAATANAAVAAEAGTARAAESALTSAIATAKHDSVYRVDDYATAQDAIDACPAGGVVLWSPGNATAITIPLAVHKSITFRGSAAFGSRIMADNCIGIIVDAGVTDFNMESVEVAALVRHTTTPNALVGILVNGSTGSRPFNHRYENVYVDGFQTYFRSDYLWGSTFDGFSGNYGHIGIDAYGLSVNNTVHGNSQIQVDAVSGSRCVHLNGRESFSDATAVASEGWTIANNMLFGAEVAVHVEGVTHCNIHDNIIDFVTRQGVLIQDYLTNFGGNCNVHDNYIAMTGASAIAAIQLSNMVDNVQRMSNRIHHNHCLSYAGATCIYGIISNGVYSQSMIDNNTLRNFTLDINLICSGNDATANHCYSTPGSAGNISSDGFVNHIEGNSGVVYLSGGNPNVYSVDALGKKVWLGLQALTTGTNDWGDRVVNSRPTVGQPKGWYCTVAGTPGTWVADANL